MMASPYTGVPVEKWEEKTRDLLAAHPLDARVIRDVALASWDTLWRTKIGYAEAAIPLDELGLPATVVGYFFEKLFARELQLRFPKEWRGGKAKDEKDLVYLAEPRFSTEMKTSGQLGFKIFGNRSYSQAAADGSLVSKIDRSGYYITVNFWGKMLTLIRFGWIDSEDWRPQAASTGQAASLAREVYQYKLVAIRGDYQLDAPVALVPSIGPKTAAILAEEKVKTLRDLRNYEGENTLVKRLRDKVKD